jgi:hypothetical protein
MRATGAMRIKRLTAGVVFAAALAAASPAWAQFLPFTPPMPLARPDDAPRRAAAPLRPRNPLVRILPPADVVAAQATCKSFLEQKTVIAEMVEPSMLENGCGAIGQARISAIRLKNGKHVELRPSALIRCETGKVFAEWVREDLDPATLAFSGIARIEVAASYHCRPRNNVRGAIMSEHGRANAIDIRAIVMNDGTRFGVDIPATPIALLAELRRSTCARFTTVLGPGSDGFHENHFHMDLAQRRSGYRLCRWRVPTLPDPPRWPAR